MRYRFAEFELDVDAETVYGPDGVVPLRQRAFQLLRLLVEESPALLGRDQILDRVWGHDALSPAVLAQTVGEIRHALGDSAQSPRLIETRHRRGYRLMVPVQHVECEATLEPADTLSDSLELPVEPQPASGETPIPSRPPSSERQVVSRTPWPIAGMVALVLVLIAAGYWLLRPTDNAGTDDSSLAQRPALALLITADERAPAWIAHAGAELLSTALAGDDRVQLVRGDGRSGEPGGSDLRWQTWLREVLGVDYAVTGLWRQQDDQVHLNYSLVALGDGRVLHSGQHQDEDLASLSQGVANELRRHLRVVEGDPGWMASLPRSTQNRDAYYRGLAKLADGASGEAIEALELAQSDAHAGARVHLALASAYRSAGRMEHARGQFEKLAALTEQLSLGERLRVEAEAALADHRPADAAASLRALHRLMPDDRDVALTLLDAQIRARQIRAAATTLASLEPLSSAGSEDPRWHLAQSRLAQLQHEPELAATAAERARELAERFGLDEIAVQAQLEQVRLQQNDGDLNGARERLQALIDRGPPESQRAEVLLQLGNLLRAQGEFDQAEEWLKQAQSIYHSRGDHGGELLARIELYIIDSERGHSEHAFAELLALEPAVAALGDVWISARYHNTLGVQAIRNLDLDAADRHLQQAASESRRAGQPRQEAGAYNNLAMALARGGRLDEAAAVWERGLTVFQDSGDRRGEAITLGNLASVANLQGDLPRSRDQNRKALVLMRELGMRQDVARLAFNLGLISEREGDLADAQSLLRESLDAYVQTGAGADFVVRVAAVHIRVLTALAELEQALAQVEFATGYLDEVRDPIAHSHLLTSHGDLLRLSGDADAARALFEQARTLRGQDTRSNWVDVSELDLLNLDLAGGGSAERVQAAAERIAARLEQDSDGRPQARALILQAKALLAAQRAGDALPVLERAARRMADHAEVGLSLELDRLRILAGQGRGSSMQARLNSLADEAERRGYAVLALRCRLDADRDDASLHQRVQAQGLSGLLND